MDAAEGPKIEGVATVPWTYFVKNVKKECGVYAMTLNTAVEVSKSLSENVDVC